MNHMVFMGFTDKHTDTHNLIKNVLCCVYSDLNKPDIYYFLENMYYDDSWQW